MNVPPYVPQPIEIAGNVAEESHLVRLGFIRRVTSLHFLSVVIVVAIASSSLPRVSALWASGLVLASLLALSLVRGLTKGRSVEQRISLAIAPPLLIGLGLLGAHLNELGWPAWALLVGPGAVLGYTLLCGRDLSFLGMYFISIIASSVALSAIDLRLGVHVPGGVVALAFNAGYTSYYVYDLAALLTRRRLGEEGGAIMDLYRDILNFSTYSVRVIRHWRKHKIWSRP